MKLRLYKEADSQLLALGNLDQAKYSNGVQVPLELRLIKAEMPHYMASADVAENSRKAQNNLYTLNYRLLNEIATQEGRPTSPPDQQHASLACDLADAKASLERCSYSLMNIFLAQEKFGLALEICQKLQNNAAEKSPELMCLMVRIYLQVGNVDEAVQVHEDLELREPKVRGESVTGDQREGGVWNYRRVNDRKWEGITGV
jgi:hypothetical protein